ncbi:Fur family transcriptional regulator [Candidatus Tenderia electrophaga]|uniref:Ferric uptake regulation protein n=1 Tax=Candidatus Tenderia electrophaga TaxID=1748243 RepID=A0A0S2THQ6_9GAMM|nr:Fur family transcriptional regulator [Candidatus Tenderia electrophaga]
MDKYPRSRAEVIDLMRHKGVNPTQQRVEIAQVLFAEPQHVSADQVLVMVNKKRSIVSKATVYNTLGLFAKKGLVREVIVDPSRVFYDPTTTPHHHFYNVDTGELMDMAPDSLSLGELPPLPSGTEAEGVDVVIRVRNSAVSC